MSGNHTPTPWTQYQLGPTMYGADGFYVGITQSKNPEADAAFIVTAVNSYASSQAEIERLAAENATLRAAATKIDADWTEAFPEGPEGNRTYLGGFGTLSDDTVEVWRVIRAALSGSKK